VKPDILNDLFATPVDVALAELEDVDLSEHARIAAELLLITGAVGMDS